MPQWIVSDQDSKFTSYFWTSLMEICGTKLNMSSAQHAETDEQFKQTIQTLIQFLQGFINHARNNWKDLLPFAEFTYNTLQHSVTKKTPFEVIYRFQLQLLIELQGGASINWTVPAVAQFVYNWVKIYNENLRNKIVNEGLTVTLTVIYTGHPNLEETQVNLEHNQQMMIKKLDSKHDLEEFHIRDQVLISTKNLDMAQFMQ